MVLPSSQRRSKSSGSATSILSRKTSHAFSSSTVCRLDRVSPDPVWRARLRPVLVRSQPGFALVVHLGWDKRLP
eukprot:4265854-Amphidinium_carterae.1